MAGGMTPPEPAPRPVGNGPAAAVRRAQAEAEAAERAVVEVSARRLVECLRLAPTERLGCLDDPDLVVADRARLRQTLQAGLRRPLSARIWPRRWRPFGRRTYKRLRGLALGLIALGAIYGLATMQNTEPATLNRQVEVRLQYPNGITRDGALPKGISLLVRRLDVTWAEARQWRVREGYITTRVPISALRF